MQKSFLIVNEGEDKFNEDLTEPMPEFNFLEEMWIAKDEKQLNIWKFQFTI